MSDAGCAPTIYRRCPGLLLSWLSDGDSADPRVIAPSPMGSSGVGEGNVKAVVSATERRRLVAGHSSRSGASSSKIDVRALDYQAMGFADSGGAPSGQPFSSAA